MRDDAGAQFAELFPEVYRRLHARRGKDSVRLTPQMMAVMMHLSMSGPLTVGEMARHLERAQSVVSEIVDGLVAKGLLERMPDARDRRRTLVWLTDAAHEAMRRDRDVLDPARLARAMSALSDAERRGLLDGMRALVRAAEALGPRPHSGPEARSPKPEARSQEQPRRRRTP
jgi:DNA-binding MarR family transcriptional regulator